MPVFLDSAFTDGPETVNEAVTPGGSALPPSLGECLSRCSSLAMSTAWLGRSAHG